MSSAIGKLRAARSGLLTTGGLASLTAGAWEGLGMWAGLVAGGLSLLVLEYLTSDTEARR